MTFPQAWERVCWQSQRAGVSDARLVTLRRGDVDGAVDEEIALDEIAAIDVVPSLLERVTGLGTVVIRSRRPGAGTIRIRHVAGARRTALRLHLAVADARGLPPDDSVAKLPLPAIWRIPAATRFRTALVAPAVMLTLLAIVVIGLSGHQTPVAYASDDPIRPNGVKKSRAEVVAFMEKEIMPFARTALDPIVGKGVGKEAVSCETCHGEDAEQRQWVMPAVKALPEPTVREIAKGTDSQVRNALHGYLTGEDKQPIAARMRGVVVPGMAKLLHRPAYDFAQTYEYNRARNAFGCYHCHRASD